MKKAAATLALIAQCRVVVVGDTCVSQEGMAAIVGRDKDVVSAAAHMVSMTQEN